MSVRNRAMALIGGPISSDARNDIIGDDPPNKYREEQYARSSEFDAGLQNGSIKVVPSNIAEQLGIQGAIVKGVYATIASELNTTLKTHQDRPNVYYVGNDDTFYAASIITPKGSKKKPPKFNNDAAKNLYENSDCPDEYFQFLGRYDYQVMFRIVKRNTPKITDGGYAAISFHGRDSDNDLKVFSVKFHRLVWHLFGGPIPPGLIVHHINGVRSDCSLSNLACITQSENTEAVNKGNGATYESYRSITRTDITPIEAAIECVHVHPTYSNYACNDAGDCVINLNTLHIMGIIETTFLLNPSGAKQYAVNIAGCVMKSRFVYECVNQEILDSKDIVDHVNGDRSDDHFLNHRKVSYAGNARNRKISRNNKSGKCGVFWDATKRCWSYQTASTKDNGKAVGRINNRCSSIDEAIRERIKFELEAGIVVRGEEHLVEKYHRREYDIDDDDEMFDF